MVNTSFYSLLRETPIPVSWFEAQLNRYSTRNSILRDTFLSPEINALREFHDGTTSVEQAAYALTRPITTSPVPSAGTTEDEIVAVTQLWRLYKDSLVEWPSSRTQDLVALGVAISELPDLLHRGEALDADDEDLPGKPLAWKDLPGIYMVWRDAHWQHPIDILESCEDEEQARRCARTVYLKQQEVQAQLVAAGLFRYELAFRAVIASLEVAKGPEERSHHDPSKDGDFEQLVLDFHIPAAARWIKYNGAKMYTSITEKGLGDLDRGGIPRGARHFHEPANRWNYWEERLGQVIAKAPDNFTRMEASAAVKMIKAIKKTS